MTMNVTSSARNVTMTQGAAIHQVARREDESAQEALRRAIGRREKEAQEALRNVARMKKALRILGVPSAPTPLFVSATHGNVTSYAFKCEGEDVLGYGDTEKEAQENWRFSYIAEHVGDASF